MSTSTALTTVGYKPQASSTATDASVPKREIKSNLSHIDSYACKAFFAIEDCSWLNPTARPIVKVKGDHQSIGEVFTDTNVKIVDLFDGEQKKGILHTLHRGTACVARFFIRGTALLVVSPVGVVVNGSKTIFHICRGARQFVAMKKDKDNTEKKEAYNKTADQVSRYAKATFTDLVYTIYTSACAALDVVLGVPIYSAYINLYHNYCVKDGAAIGSGPMRDALVRTIDLKHKFGLCQENGKALNVSADDIDIHELAKMMEPSLQAHLNEVVIEISYLFDKYNVGKNLNVNSRLTFTPAFAEIREKITNKLKEQRKNDVEIATILKDFDRYARSTCNFFAAISPGEEVRNLLNIADVDNYLPNFIKRKREFKNDFSADLPANHPFKDEIVAIRAKILIDASALELFGFDKIPTEQELKQRYRKLMLLVHPDQKPEAYKLMAEALSNVLGEAKIKIEAMIANQK